VGKPKRPRSSPAAGTSSDQLHIQIARQQIEEAYRLLEAAAVEVSAVDHARHLRDLLNYLVPWVGSLRSEIGLENLREGQRFFGEDSLTVSELCARLRVTPECLRQWRHRNQGPGFWKLGGRVFYPREKVERWEFARGLTSPHEDSST